MEMQVSHNGMEVSEFQQFIRGKTISEQMLPARELSLADYFERFEDKYLLSMKQYENMFKLVSSNMHRDPFQKDIAYTAIDSIYLDTQNFDFYTHHVMGKEIRQKMRVRCYTNGESEGGAPLTARYLLEIKKKENDFTKKIRFTISYDIFQELLHGRWPKWEEVKFLLMELNEKLSIKKLQKRFTLAEMTFVENNLHPILSISYKRAAFEDSDFRITFDYDLEAMPMCGQSSFLHFAYNNVDVLEKALPLLEKYQRSEESPSEQNSGAESDRCVVMEIKHKNNRPSWFCSELEKMQLLKESFSKYCHFITKFTAQSKVLVSHLEKNSFERTQMTKESPVPRF